MPREPSSCCASSSRPQGHRRLLAPVRALGIRPCRRHALIATPPSDESRPHGVFATRSPRRPNPIGLTVVELLRREASLHVRGVDMLDGTPVLDIKPYLSSIPAEKLRRGWLAEAEGAKKQGTRERVNEGTSRQRSVNGMQPRVKDSRVSAPTVALRRKPGNRPDPPAQARVAGERRSFSFPCSLAPCLYGIPSSLCVCRLSRHCGCSRQ